MQTLRDVVENRGELLWRMEAIRDERSSIRIFDSVEMDGVVVLSNINAQRYLEFNYVYDTHFVPNRLPGIGLSTGDIITHEGGMYLTVNFSVMEANVAALHLLREHDLLYVEWHNRREEMEEMFLAFLKKVHAVTNDYFGIEEFKLFAGFKSSVGWSDVGTPSVDFLKVLDMFSEMMIQRRKKGMRELARNSSFLSFELRPYSTFQDFMKDLRTKTRHKGFPRVQNGMLQFNTPAASGGAVMHTHNPSDDLYMAMPSYGDLFIVASQAGNTGVTHLGSGSITGEHYFMLPPMSPFFSLVQEQVDVDSGLVEEWERISGSEEKLNLGFKEWFDKTRGIKEQVVKEIVPGLVEERVLGFQVDMVSKKGVALLRPVVSESHLQRHTGSINGLQVLRKNFVSVLAETPKGYGELKSVL